MASLKREHMWTLSAILSVTSCLLAWSLSIILVKRINNYQYLRLGAWDDASLNCSDQSQSSQLFGWYMHQLGTSQVQTDPRNADSPTDILIVFVIDVGRRNGSLTPSKEFTESLGFLVKSFRNIQSSNGYVIDFELQLCLSADQDVYDPVLLPIIRPFQELNWGMGKFLIRKYHTALPPTEIWNLVLTSWIWPSHVRHVVLIDGNLELHVLHETRKSSNSRMFAIIDPTWPDLIADFESVVAKGPRQPFGIILYPPPPPNPIMKSSLSLGSSLGNDIHSTLSLLVLYSRPQWQQFRDWLARQLPKNLESLSSCTDYSRAWIPIMNSYLNQSSELMIQTTGLTSAKAYRQEKLSEWFHSKTAIALSGAKHNVKVPSMLNKQMRSQIIKHGMAHGGKVTLTVVTYPFLSMARSWLCNVDSLHIRPPGIIWIVSDDETFIDLRNIPGTLVLMVDSLQGPYDKEDAEYGSASYWKLMISRSVIVHEILATGLCVFLFETDALWLRDPMRYVEHALAKGADVLGALDTRGEIGGNFLYIASNTNTRYLFLNVARVFIEKFTDAYKNSPWDASMSPGKLKKKKKKKSQLKNKYVPNDQSTLTRLALFESEYRTEHPISFLALNSSLVADGQWYALSRSEQERWLQSLVVINNNFIRGIDNKVDRAKKFGHWFWNGRDLCLVEPADKLASYGNGSWVIRRVGDSEKCLLT